MELTAAVVETLVARLFSPEVRAEAANVLARYGTQVHEREPIRVRVAALKLSDGSLVRLADLNPQLIRKTSGLIREERRSL